MRNHVESGNQPEHGTNLSFCWCVCLLKPVSSAYSGRPPIWEMFWRRFACEETWMDQLKQRLVSGLHDCKARTADKYWVTIPSIRSPPKVHAKLNLYFSPQPCWWRKIQCVPIERRFGIFQFGILLFSQLCFLTTHSLGRRCPLLHSPQSAQMHFVCPLLHWTAHCTLYCSVNVMNCENNTE